MKKINLFLVSAWLLLLPVLAGAQTSDAPKRTTEVVVAEALAQLPAAQPAAFDSVMAELAATGSRGVELIAGQLVPADKGQNATLEYALSGIVSYVTAPGRESLRADLRKGLLTALDRCGDDANRVFLLSQLQLCSTAEDAAALIPYLEDPYLFDPVLRALITIPGTELQLVALAKGDLSQQRKRALAYAYGEKQISAAEPILLKWLAGADVQTTAAIYHALVRCGGEASLRPLAAATAQVDYGDDSLGATDAYLRLLSNRVKAGASKSAVKSAKALLGCERQYVRGAALGIVVEAMGVSRAMPFVLDAIEKGGAEYRFAALQTLGKGDEKIYTQIASHLPRCAAQAQAAVVAWLGEQVAVSQSDVITAATTSADAQLAVAAIEASGRIGGQQALMALVGALDGPHSEQATRALLAFNGRIDAQVVELLRGDDPKRLVPALRLAAARGMHSVCERVFVLLDAQDEAVRMAAYAALPRVCSPSDAERLSALLAVTDDRYVAPVQLALIRTLKGLSADEQYTRTERSMRASKVPSRYYPVLAQTGTDAAVENLHAAFDRGDREAAFAALLTIENPAMIDLLYRLTTANPELTDRALMRYAELVARRDFAPDYRYQLCRQGLELKPSAAVRGRLLGYLSSVRTLPALMLAGEYLDDPEVAEAAAGAVKKIVARSSPMFGGEAVRKLLEQARAVYLRNPDADAGYAADEITELLGQL